MWSRRTSSTTISAADPPVANGRRRRSAPIHRLGAAFAVTLLLAGCDPGAGDSAGSTSEADPGVRLEGEAMGTSFHVRVPSASADLEQALSDLVRAELDAVDRAMSTWRTDSELSRLNRAPGNEPVALSTPTFELIERALALQEATEGAFDVTVGPLVEAWGFGPEGVVTAVPSPAEIERLQALTGPGALVLDVDARTVTKASAEVRIDLSAIAKGYSVDRVAAALARNGHDDFMVEVGGEVVTRGRPSAERPWRIGVENPRGGIQRLLSLTDAALASSGSYRSFYELDGRTVSHTIDPRSGRPVDHRAVAVSVLAEDCATADALATAMMVLGDEAGIAWADARGVAVLFLVDRAGRIVERPSRAFEAGHGTLQ